MSGDLYRKQVEAGRQAYIVYPVIEGAKDDQPELDFPQDEEEERCNAAGRTADSSTALRSMTTKSRKRKKAQGEDR